MAEGTRKQASQVFTVLFIGLIVLSFIFTGYQSMQAPSSDTVGMVGDYPIRIREFDQEYKRQTMFYQQIYNGGKELTSAQIEQFDIRRRAFQVVANRKISLVLGQKLGINPSEKEVAAEIKKQPYFLTNGQFDLQKYKMILANNRLPIADFETEMREGLVGTKVGQLLGAYPVSTNYVKELENFRRKSMKATLVSFNKAALVKRIPVTAKERAEYLADTVNANRVEATFKERKPSLDQQEEVNASHILLRANSTNRAQVKAKIFELAKKVNAKNFKSMANKHTEDPSGKDKGGALNWFGKKMMDPAFEKVAFSQKVGTVSAPVETAFGWHLILVNGKKAAKEAKFEDHKKGLVNEIIRKGKKTELESEITGLRNKITRAIGSKSSLARLKDEYKLTVMEGVTLNILDGVVGNISLQAKEKKDIFSKGLNQNELYTFDRASSVVVAKTWPDNEASSRTRAADETQKERKQLSDVFARTLNRSLTEKLRETVDIKAFPNLRL